MLFYITLRASFESKHRTLVSASHNQRNGTSFTLLLEVQDINSSYLIYAIFWLRLGQSCLLFLLGLCSVFFNFLFTSLCPSLSCFLFKLLLFFLSLPLEHQLFMFFELFEFPQSIALLRHLHSQLVNLCL